MMLNANMEYVAIRTMREAARTWGDANEGYLQAAVTFADNFNGWVKPQ